MRASAPAQDPRIETGLRLPYPMAGLCNILSETRRSESSIAFHRLVRCCNDPTVDRDRGAQREPTGSAKRLE